MKTIAKDFLSTWGVMLALPLCFCCGCLFFAFLQPRIHEEWTVYQRKQDLPEVEAEFNALVDDLPRSKFDTVLSIHTHSLTIGRESGCIWGNTDVVRANFWTQLENSRVEDVKGNRDEQKTTRAQGRIQVGDGDGRPAWGQVHCADLS